MIGEGEMRVQGDAQDLSLRIQTGLVGVRTTIFQKVGFGTIFRIG